MPGTCGLPGLAESAAHGSGTKKQKLMTDALECQCRQREGIKPAGNVMGFFLSCCSFLAPSYSCLS